MPSFSKPHFHVYCGLVAFALLAGVAVHAQALFPAAIEIDAKLEAAQKSLRDAMIQLRDVRIRSCRLGRTTDCELATLSDVELSLLDIEVKYHRASRSALIASDAEKWKKVKETAGEARSKVDELIDILK